MRIMSRFFLTILLIYMSAVLHAQERVDTLEAAVKTDVRKAADPIAVIETDVNGIRGVLSPLGEGDPIKWVQTLPGIASGADGSSSFFVRGGNMGNNLITLDGVPVYGYSHLLGLTTVIPQDVIEGVSLVKGGFIGGDGNFTSSHLSICTRTPDAEGFRMSASLNNFLASVSAETHIGKDMSLLLSGRISPLALEYKALRGMLPGVLNGFEDLSAGVGDLYGKFHWQVDDNHDFSVSILGSRDNYAFTAPSGDYDKMGWDNIIGLAKYGMKDGNVSTDLELSLNQYGSHQVQGKDFRGEWQVLSLKSDLLETAASVKRTHVFDKGLFGYGLKGRYARFMPGQVASARNVTNALLFTAYGQAEYNLSCGLSLAGALRAHYWQNLTSGAGRVDPDVSLSARWDINRIFSLQGTYDRMVQYYHTLEGFPVGWSLDMIVPSGKTAVPELSQQGSFSLSSSLGKHILSLGGYIRQMDNLVYYRYAQSLFNGALAAWEDNVDVGSGTSYGGEFFYEYDGDDLYSRLSYTLSKTNRYGFPSVCNGGEFNARFDRRHVLNAMVQWKGFSAALTLQSGHWENGAPETYIMHLPGDVTDSSIAGDGLVCDKDWTAYYFGNEVNNYHMPMVFRLDLGYAFSFTTGKIDHDVNVGVCNVTNHFNPFMLYYDAQSEGFKMIALLPILPNFSYRINF